MKIDDIIQIVIMGLLVITFSIVLIGITMILIDYFTVKQIGTERVKCIDKIGAEFVDEYCKKEVYCSWLGMAANKKCKEVI